MGNSRQTSSNGDREIRTVKFDLSIEERADEGKKIVGYAAVFNAWTDLGWFQERVMPGAFSQTIAEDDIRVLFNHDPNYVLGRTSSATCKLKEDERGLYMEVTPPDTQQARDIMTLIERGDISGQSFSFIVRRAEWEYGEGNDPDRRSLTDVQLFDVGPVTFPAYEQTSVDLRSYEEFRKERKTSPPELRRLNKTRRQRLNLSEKTKEVSTHG